MMSSSSSVSANLQPIVDPPAIVLFGPLFHANRVAVKQRSSHPKQKPPLSTSSLAFQVPYKTTVMEEILPGRSTECQPTKLPCQRSSIWLYLKRFVLRRASGLFGSPSWHLTERYGVRCDFDCLIAVRCTMIFWMFGGGPCTSTIVEPRSWRWGNESCQYFLHSHVPYTHKVV